ncbi:unnamed protein product [Didymodactylos carnosus]|uniref:Uncharacterized protein n=1 Tax=Didymodactylos carnosus TaxID=1234261 RepID=A0A814F0P1_9BILA|nr:unnamed protein product [Didymodactylos carnosus]CAF0976483.1 unnamed protein product [Didymodactylos carnosus]CAF3572635.1 unnamed protein product [Didymodactylos carnosus]CAF3749341.1 unnamed protein product [Didymodactylos carnosus]
MRYRLILILFLIYLPFSNMLLINSTYETIYQTLLANISNYNVLFEQAETQYISITPFVPQSSSNFSQVHHWFRLDYYGVHVVVIHGELLDQTYDYDVCRNLLQFSYLLVRDAGVYIMSGDSETYAFNLLVMTNHQHFSLRLDDHTIYSEEDFQRSVVRLPLTNKKYEFNILLTIYYYLSFNNTNLYDLDEQSNDLLTLIYLKPLSGVNDNTMVFDNEEFCFNNTYLSGSNDVKLRVLTITCSKNVTFSCGDVNKCLIYGKIIPFYIQPRRFDPFIILKPTLQYQLRIEENEATTISQSTLSSELPDGAVTDSTQLASRSNVESKQVILWYIILPSISTL